MLHYVTLGTNDLSRARRFYAPVLDCLGITSLQDGATETGYGLTADGVIRLFVTQPYDAAAANHGNGSMIALAASTRAAVTAFHAAALGNGGTDEGAPGLRYSAHFFSCYVRDPDGNKLSAVCEAAE